MRPHLAAAVLASLLLAACGDDDKPSTTTSAATATAASTATSAAAGELDEDALFAVHDALAECLRKAEGTGVLVQFREGGTVTISNESSNPPEYDDSLGAPEATEKLIGEGAQFVGLRDDKKEDGRTPDWDILIFASEDAAVAAYPELSEEVGDPAGAVQSGRFVTVVLPDAEANGDDPEASEATLKTCVEEAEAAA
jgi:hypothetical protein